MLVSLVEVFLFTFVFPGEAALFPDVGKAAFRWLAGVRSFVDLKKLRVFDHVLLEAKRFGAGRVGLPRLYQHPEGAAQMFRVRESLKLARLGGSPSGK